MPYYTFENGLTTNIPGVVDYEETVVLGRDGPVPQFMVPIIIGTGLTGYPVNFDSVKQTDEATKGAFTKCSGDGDVRSIFHPQSDIAIAYQNAQEAGLPMAFCGAVNALVRAKVVAQSGSGPAVDEFTLYSRLFGAVGGHHKVKYASGIIEITPVRNSAFLSENAASTDTRIYIYSQDPGRSPIEWVQPGRTYTLGDNSTPNFTATVLKTGYEIDSNGQYKYYIDFTQQLGTALTAFGSDYALIVEYSDDVEKNDTAFLAGEGQKLVDWIKTNSKYLSAEKASSFTGTLPNDVATSTPIKEITAWGTVTDGASPLVTSSDWTTFFTNYQNTYWDDFRQRHGITPYLHLMLTELSVDHAKAVSFANNRWTNKTPVTFYLGAGYTDVAVGAGNDTAPEYRANALNSQHVALCAGKVKKLAPYLSLAAMAFGFAAANGSTVALTNKEIPRSWHIDKVWTDDDLETLIGGGVLTYMLRQADPATWVVAEDANTNQDRSTTWSAATNTTSLMHSRHAVNEWWAGLRNKLASMFPGNTSVTPALVAQVLYNWDQTALNRGLIVERKPPSSIDVNNVTGTISIVPNISPPTQALFVAVKPRIIIS